MLFVYGCIGIFMGNWRFSSVGYDLNDMRLINLEIYQTFLDFLSDLENIDCEKTVRIVKLTFMLFKLRPFQN